MGPLLSAALSLLTLAGLIFLHPLPSIADAGSSDDDDDDDEFAFFLRLALAVDSPSPSGRVPAPPSPGRLSPLRITSSTASSSRTMSAALPRACLRRSSLSSNTFVSGKSGSLLSRRTMTDLMLSGKPPGQFCSRVYRVGNLCCPSRTADG